ncbi:MAG: GNAT family N-acetyltransferase [Frankiaceae bacterium]|nr:GNAT family N-acetyltransferase [Frankiaceae bacterium]
MVGGFEPPAIGTTVTLQVETPVGSIGVVGVLLEVVGDRWSVRRRDGTIADVDAGRVAAMRVVPPGRAARATVDEVERAALLGWRALEVQTLGDWALRASGGFTGRGNSALPLGDPGIDLEAALDRVAAFYSERSLPLRVQLVDRGAPPGLHAAIDRRGWGASPRVQVMTAELGHVLRAAPAADGWDVRVAESPDDEWVECYRQDGVTPRDLVRAVLTNHPTVGFASLRRDGQCVAIARGCVDGKWCGIHAVEVRPDHRGAQLGAAVTAVAARWCAQRGARRTYLQVSVENAPAVRTYEKLNFAVHHHYVYREGPS